MSDESLAVDEYIWRTLTEDVILSDLIGERAYGEHAPQGAALPLVLFSMLSANDVRGSGNVRIMVDSLWVIRGVVQDASFNDASKAMAESIDRLFQDGDGRIVDEGKATVFQSHREQAFRLVEETAGKPFRHLGGIYRFYSQSLEV